MAFPRDTATYMQKLAMIADFTSEDDEDDENAIVTVGVHLLSDCSPATNSPSVVVAWIQKHNYSGQMFLWLYSCGYQFVKADATKYTTDVLGEDEDLLIKYVQLMGHIGCLDLASVLLSTIDIPGARRVDIVKNMVTVPASPMKRKAP